MPRKPIKFDLDFLKKDIFSQFAIKQFDDVTFNITPKINNEAYNVANMTGKIYVGVNNEMFMQDTNITVSSNSIVINLDKNILKNDGRAYAEIELTDSTGTVTSTSFIFDIDRKIGEGANIPGQIDGFVAKYEKLTAEFKKKFQDSLNDVDNRFNILTSSQQQDSEVILARKGETSLEVKIDKIDEQFNTKVSYQEVDEKIALAKLEGASVDTSKFTVKSELENSIKNGNIYLDFGIWEDGFINATGEPTTTEIWNVFRRTRDFHAVNKNVTYTFKATNGANCIIRKYNADKLYIGSVNTSSILNVKFTDCDYIRIAINNADSSQTKQSEKNITITSSYEGVFALDEKYKELIQTNSSLLKDYFQAIPTGANEITINTTDKTIYFPKCYVYSNGKSHAIINETTLSYKDLTNFVWIYANATTKNIELLSNYNNTSNMLFLGLIPIQSERVNLSHVHFSYKILGQNNNADYKGKTFAVLGDSISTFVGISEDSQNAVAYRKEYYPNITANINSYSEMWWGVVQDTLGMTRTGVSAISQSCYRTQNDTTRQEGYADERINRLSSDGVPDYVFIALGTNDGYNAYSVDYDGSIDKDTLLTNATKTAPACALTILKVQEKYPNAKIIVVIPKFCNISKLGYSSSNFMKVCEGIKAIANSLGVYKVIDLRKSGVNYANVDDKTIDGIHPNKSGMLDMGNYVVEELIK